jgi:hypothetical protein
MDAVATAKLALDASGMDRGLKKAEDSLNKFAKQAGTALVGAFAMDKVISGFSTAIEKGDQLQDIAEKFGVSASKLQLLGNAATVFGSNLEQVSAGLNKLSLAQQKAISGESGSEALVETFAEVGISMDQLKTMSAEDIFLKISDSFASGANDGRQFIIVNELLGKAQTDLIKVMNQGSAAIIAQGESMGVWSDETISQLSEASDAIKTLQNKFVKGFGLMAQGIMPVVKTLEMLSEQLGFAIASAGALMSGDFKDAMGIAGAATTARKNFGKDTTAPKAKTGPIDTEGGPSEKEKLKAEKSAIKDAAAAEKDAIKDRTEEAMRVLANEESEKKLANDSYERDRARATERMLEAANIEVQAAMEKQRINKEQANMMTGPGGTSRQYEQTKAGAAGEVLNFAGGLGDKGISDTVTRERAKAAKDQQAINRKEFDAKVMESTSATAGGGPRTMASRRQEFIKSEAGKEAKGQKTLSDVYTVLEEALRKLTSAPLVGAGA